MRRLVVVVNEDDSGAEDEERLAVAEVVRRLKKKPGSILFRYDEVELRTPHAAPLGFPLKTGIACLAASRGKVVIADSRGARNRLSLGWFASEAMSALRIKVRTGRIRPKIARLIRSLETPHPSSFAAPKGSPVYLRTNLWFGATVGGSYSHSAGIINALSRHYGSVKVLSTEPLPGLYDEVEVKRLEIERIEGVMSGETGVLLAADGLLRLEREAITAAPEFVYQRYALGDISGLRLARQLKCPYVLEYNGSEVWVARHWAAGLKQAKLFADIERTLLQGSDLVLAISDALVPELIDLGVSPSRILVSPNAVDPERFNPAVSGDEVRTSWRLQNRTIALLVSTFGPWHGIPVLLEAFARMIRRDQALARQAGLVLVGDGALRVEMEQKVGELRLTDHVRFQGSARFENMPAVLAAADICVSPQTPNTDGTTFFGSPTKMFEYMAMAKPIVASRLGQIAELIEDGASGWLVEPGDVEALSHTLADAFADEGKRSRFGAAARARALQSHTWDQRVSALAHRVELLRSSGV